MNSHEWKGAVLFLVNETHIFLIKRSDSMPTHSGQLAFVGGHKRENETDPWIVAQREFKEETGLDSEYLEFLGYLPAVHTARMLPIVPVMAKLTIPTMQYLKTMQSNGEWDLALAYPWDKMANEQAWEFAWRNGTNRAPILFHEISANSYESVQGNSSPQLLWGATAGMIWSFLKLYFRQ